MSDFLMSNESFIQPEVSKPTKPPILFLLTKEMAEAEQLGVQLSYFGYQIRIFTKHSDLSRALWKDAPKALIVLWDYGMGEFTEMQSFTRGFARHAHSIPVLIVSKDDSMDTRLKAVRAGAAAFFVHPVDAGALIGAVEEFSNPEMRIPYRILIIDESVSQASYFAMHIERVGMETRIVTDLPNLVQPLVEFNPDLILVERELPDCTGSEIAQVIHQIENFVSAPVVYLSAESDGDQKLDMMSLGGEYILTKPVNPKLLVSVVTARARRYRRLRSMMLNDGLTGLLNHTSIKDRLDNEILRASREHKPLSFAMIDLDYFKRINDLYGHGSGDRVLKSAARLFKQRLRRTDLIGRNGGDEFAVILPNTPAVEAASVMDYLRESFSNLQHRTHDAAFTQTFSCGVAAYPEFGTAALISQAADRAMYQAKRCGRNRVIRADSPEE